MKAYLRTHVGLVRSLNEDTVRIQNGRHGLYILADGMGGHQAGEVASALAADTLSAVLAEASPSLAALTQAYASANAAIYAMQQEDPLLRGMGTTLTVLWESDTHVLVGHVGDSRAYLMLDGRLYRMTEDHSVVEEMLRAGTITAAQARSHPLRSVITRAMGTERTVRADVCEILKTPGAVWLLCSDGLTDMVDDRQIADILSHQSGEEAAQALVDCALANGGRDNVSVIVLEVAS